MKAATRSCLGALLLLALAAIAYEPAITAGGFVWDDDQHVSESRLLADAEGLRAVDYATDEIRPIIERARPARSRASGSSSSSVPDLDLLCASIESSVTALFNRAREARIQATEARESAT